MAGEGDAAIVDHALVHRRGDHGGEFSGQAPVYGAVQRRQHIAGIGRVQPSGGGGGRQRHIANFQSLFGGGSAGRVIMQRKREAKLARTRGQHGLVADQHATRAGSGLRQPQRQVRAYAGGFAGGDGQYGDVHAYFSSSRSSTKAESRSWRTQSAYACSILRERICCLTASRSRSPDTS